MSDCCSAKACELDILRQRQSSVLKIVLGINAAMFVVEFVAGLLSGSVSLLADSLDMLGDSMVYAFSIYAVAESARTKAISALIKGGIMGVFGLFTAAQVVYTLAVPHAPSYEAIGVIGVLALAANGSCFALLWRHRSDDINMSSVWLCSRIDIIANVSVIAAAAGVWATGRGWPDLVVGAGIAMLFLKSAATVIARATRELRLSRA